MMNVVINNVYIKRKVRLRVQREDGYLSEQREY